VRAPTRRRIPVIAIKAHRFLSSKPAPASYCSSRPGQWNLLLGQPALELTLPTYAALYNARRAPGLSGLALAISMYKPTFGIPLAVLTLVPSLIGRIGRRTRWPSFRRQRSPLLLFLLQVHDLTGRRHAISIKQEK
jgi:hypothetical protein